MSPSPAWLRVGAAAALAALLSLDANPASACSCAEPPEPEAAMAGADVVFEGTPRDEVLLEADLGFLGYTGAKRFDFEVVRYFKGQLGPDVSVFTIDQGSACGREYALDEPHLIYARYSESGLLTDFLCSRSHPSSLGSGDVAVLGAGVAPDATLVSADDEAGSAEGSEFSSGIQHLPLEPEPEANGCALSAARAPRQHPWLAAVIGVAALAVGMRRRAAR